MERGRGERRERETDRQADRVGGRRGRDRERPRWSDKRKHIRIRAYNITRANKAQELTHAISLPLAPSLSFSLPLSFERAQMKLKELRKGLVSAPPARRPPRDNRVKEPLLAEGVGIPTDSARQLYLGDGSGSEDGVGVRAVEGGEGKAAREGGPRRPAQVKLGMDVRGRQTSQSPTRTLSHARARNAPTTRASTPHPHALRPRLLPRDALRERPASSMSLSKRRPASSTSLSRDRPASDLSLCTSRPASSLSLPRDRPASSMALSRDRPASSMSMSDPHAATDVLQNRASLIEVCVGKALSGCRCGG